MSTQRHIAFFVKPLLAVVVCLGLLALALPSGALRADDVTPTLNAGTLAATTHYVALGGDCGGAAPCYATIQAALDAAVAGDAIKVAQGTYTTSSTAIASITKALTLSGGYATSNWDTAQPDVYPTILDAEDVSGRRGIYVNAGETANVVIEGLTVENGFGENALGGGIYIADGTVVLRQLVVRNSSADGTGNRGGGVHVLDGDVTVESCTIEGNTAGAGGGLYIEDGRLLVKNSVLRQNAAYFGGGVAASILADLDLESNLFDDNTGSYGGGAFAESGYGYVTEKRVVGNTFHGNTSYYGGGGAEFRGGALLEENLFEANSVGIGAVGGEPTGGLKVGGPAVLNRNRFFNNTGEYGGAISIGGPNMLDAGSVTLNANHVRDNQADVAGGALYLSAGTVKAANDVITMNDSPNAGVYVATGQLNARHWTLVGNGPYGVYVEEGSAEIANTIAASHTTAAFWGAVSADHTLFAGNGTDCGDSATCTNNLSGDPKFMDPVSGNYHIDTESAAIDQGADTDVTDDVDGEPRDTLPDLGADEFTLPVAPRISIAKLESDALLSWQHSSFNSAGYLVFSGTTPYFLPEGLGDPVPPADGTVSYTVSGILANDQARYFIVRGTNRAGRESDDSNRVGEFGFLLVPGVE